LSCEHAFRRDGSVTVSLVAGKKKITAVVMIRRAYEQHCRA
jgi:hypothetical protein